MHKSIVVFEVAGGSDKYFDGHRRDTMPIVNAIREAGWSAEVVYYRPEWKDDLYTYVSENFDGYISRVNPGNIPGGERGYFELLTSLSVAGLVGMSTPGEINCSCVGFTSELDMGIQELVAQEAIKRVVEKFGDA